MSKEDFLKTVGENIKAVRTDKNISLDELSEMTGIRKDYLIKIEKGEAFRFTTTKFLKIKEALNSSFETLLKNL